jgi:UDP-N-acetylmuramoyl-tripeptide--D-alanyl-D-alanine ligase
MSQAALYQASFLWQEVLAACGASAERLSSSELPLPTAPLVPFTDSRHPVAGGLYIPLVGERFDGHAFLKQVAKAGAAAVLVQSSWWQAHRASHKALLQQVQVLQVPDTLLAYMALGRFHRLRFPNTQVIALTGSSGKTTVKDMLVHCLSYAGRTVGTLKNHNNDIGLTQTLLSLEPETEWLVTEMGMRGLGQIRRLTLHALPNIALVLNIGPAHIGLLGSLEAIAEAKTEIYEGLNPETGTAIYNADDPVLSLRLNEVALPKTRMGFTIAGIEGYRETEEGQQERLIETTWLPIPLPGKHQVSNVLAVLAVWRAYNLPLELLREALLSFTAKSEGRWHLVMLSQTRQLMALNDAYNANPASMKAALHAFLNPYAVMPPSKKILVLGAFNELGEHSVAYHKALGLWLAEQPEGLMAAVAFVGEEAEPAYTALKEAKPALPCCWVAQAAAVPEALQALKFAPWPLSQSTLFLKGSRSHHLETLLPLLSDEGG